MTGEPPPLARAALARAAQHRTDEQWLRQAWPVARVLLVDANTGGQALVRDAAGAGEHAELVLVDPAQAPETGLDARIFVGVDVDGTPLFAVDAPLPDLPGTRRVTVRDVGHLLGDRDAGLLTTAAALVGWHARHRYAPATGLPTRSVDGGWSRVDSGGVRIWPRTDPAVIALVQDGRAGPQGRCLLANHHTRRGDDHGRLYSCLAGYVEPGESAEAAVAREVAEEVGVQLSGLAYLGSQSWPFPGTLMLGYFAYVDADQPIEVDPEEIVRARWFTRAEVAALLAGQRVDSGDGFAVRLAPPASIAAFLIRRWMADDRPNLGP
ncbi:NAD(+) diphosphatase [Solwaraspora sp. WMMB335]|uniref:NAD(+) diphosphatase n=1 Tax=Solwaraspora sp. WMMB335 TaxID=3404118 RepID=UPI003B9599F9